MPLYGNMKEEMLDVVSANVTHLVLLDGSTEVTEYEPITWNPATQGELSMDGNVLFDIDTSEGDVTVDRVKMINSDGTEEYGETSTTSHTFTSDGTYNLESLQVQLP